MPTSKDTLPMLGNGAKLIGEKLGGVEKLIKPKLGG